MEYRQELKAYYSAIYPHAKIFRTFNFSLLREVPFVGLDKNYIRYLTFSTPEDFQRKLEQIVPFKIDIGPIYDIQPLKSNGAVPIARELVFDIDLTDYPRACCESKTVCEKCYEKIKCAIKILDYSLRKELGFKRVGFVFSGRRGVHCWVMDDPNMSGVVRSNIYRFYQEVINKSLYVPEYDRIMRRYAHGCPGDAGNGQKTKEAGDSKGKLSETSAGLINEWFVRLDKQVTVSVGHLIKSPFSIHPDTLKVSVPLDPKSIAELKDIPTLFDVLENPSILEPYLEIFEQF